MFKVIGGSYREKCLEPSWNHLFGSGLRAAAAASEIVRDAKQQKVSLITWAAQSERRELELRGASFGVEVDVRARSEPIEFQYEHGLAVPKIWPDPHRISRIETADLTFDSDAVLIFGLMEDRTPGARGSQLKVAASTVVFDPQSEANSIPWSEMGSKCDRLAIVANLKEAETMAAALGLTYDHNGHKPTEVAKSLCAAERAQVVVVKNGAEGAFVVTPDDVHRVSSYKPRWMNCTGPSSNHLFPIGTGDVFSGVFAAYWGEIGADPVEAAQRASAAAAYHNACRPMPIPADPEKVLEDLEEHYIPLSDPNLARKTVYIAGPLFNFQQRWFIEEIRRCLGEHGVKNFSPYHDVGLVSANKPPQQIFEKDIDGLCGSAVVFAIVDGLDAGTLFEIGYAAAKGIPVVAFRQCARDRDLTMLFGSPNCKIYEDFPTAIYQAAWTALES